MTWLIADRLVKHTILEKTPACMKPLAGAQKNEIKPRLRGEWDTTTVSGEFVAAFERDRHLIYYRQRSKVNF
jgi:hypothetical protein